ncbi:MAG: DNA polymerase III subunit alpha [Chloroflexi bacterium]|nr:DNA polymerase III subunit alpha [Chloroflexota bacterium]
MSTTYAELHCHSNYSFQEGASSVEDLLVRSKELGHQALALTDHDNLCGAMHFAQVAKSLEMQAITGAEITLNDGSHLTLLAETRQGYSNLCNLISHSYIGGDRRNPKLDPRHLPELAQGIILLTGCRNGRIPSLLAEGDLRGAQDRLEQYLDWFGTANVFVELQQNLVRGDTPRNRRLVELARKHGLPVVATNNVHYHVPERHRLQDALVAIKNNLSLEETHRQRRSNGQFYLKSPAEMAALFADCPEAIENTLRIAQRCSFVLTKDLNYQFPDYPVPEGFTPQSYLEHLCYQAAERRYGRVTDRVKTRLEEEFRLIERHNLAGFLLIYYDIIQMARQIMIELGLSDVEIPLEERPPGRGRGSSVAMLVGYLIGLSHIDPLEFNLSLDRFLSDGMGSVPDIDLDFPRNIREELIKRVHEKWGWERAALTGMISTYKLKGAVRDLGKALGLPAQEVDKLAKRADSYSAKSLRLEMLSLPEFKDKVDAPVWRDLIDLASQLDGFPKYLAQHPGGMVISSSPLTDMVPVQQAAIDGRYLCHWDKDSIDQAGFVKIDFLALGALSQMQETLQLIEEREGHYIDLSRIDFNDLAVYEMMHKGDTIGVFQVESAAQMQTIPRIKPLNLTDMAYEVGAVRPGVGVNDGVTQFIRRRSQGVPWDYDHPLERRALERTLGIILFQDQVNQVAMDVAGFSAMEADQLRRAFIRRNNQDLIAFYWEKFRRGAMNLGVPEKVAEKIFKKFNGHYMFPESHAFAFGVTAYHMAWLKHYYPMEFFVAIFNQQPMGFYNTETLKEDARRHGIRVLNPDINASKEHCVIKDEALLLGLLYVKGVGEAAATSIVQARERDGAFRSLADAMERTGLRREALENLVTAGAFDPLVPERRAGLWEVGLRYRPKNSSPAGYQLALPLPVEQDMAELPGQSQWEVMLEEYRTLSMHPKGHLMAMLRPHLGSEVLSSQQVLDLPDGTEVTVAGLVIRRQRPLAKAVFITLEDEFGHVPLIVWPKMFMRYRLVLREPVLIVRGEVSRRDGTMNIVAKHVEDTRRLQHLPKSKNWG